jgi:uncharacterized membrane protein AbrB (regulator of aidB expression)
MDFGKQQLYVILAEYTRVLFFASLLPFLAQWAVVA